MGAAPERDRAKRSARAVALVPRRKSSSILPNHAESDIARAAVGSVGASRSYPIAIAIGFVTKE